MPLASITPPSAEPISVDEAKRYIKEDWNDANNDTDIAQAIRACRELCENDARRALMTQKWRLTMDSFPMPGAYASVYYGMQWGSGIGSLLTPPRINVTGLEIFLPLPPLQSVDKVSYVDGNGATVVMDPTTYAVDNATEPGRLTPAYGTSWPTARIQPNAVAIEFTAGYGTDPTLVPACARQWIKATLGTVYEMRQSELIMERGSIEVPSTVTRLLDPIRVRSY